jgi:hypothetical protein
VAAGAKAPQADTTTARSSNRQHKAKRFVDISHSPYLEKQTRLLMDAGTSFEMHSFGVAEQSPVGFR